MCMILCISFQKRMKNLAPKIELLGNSGIYKLTTSFFSKYILLLVTQTNSVCVPNLETPN